MDAIRKLARTDLNLLLVFRAVDETRHVTKAARLLGVSQPALSHALARLRQAFDDPLFVRTPRGMAATPRAEELAGPIGAALAQLAADVYARGPFTPDAIERTFRIRTTDFMEQLTMPGLLRIMAAEAPRARVVAAAVGTALPAEELERGTTDLAIAGFFGSLPDGFRQQRLFTDEFMCAVRKDHPALRGGKGGLSLDAFCEERHVLIAPGGELAGKVDQELKKLKRRREVVAGLSNFLVSGWVAARSDCVLTAPSRLVRELAALLPLKAFAPPVTLPKIAIVQVWHERSERDQAHRWLRAAVRRSLEGE